jgi:hypothetical protein
LAGADIDKAKGQVFKTIKGKRRCIGRVGADGTPRRGFPTPTRLIEVKDDIFREAVKAVGISESDPLADPLPTWFPIPGHETRIRTTITRVFLARAIFAVRRGGSQHS